MPHIKTGRSRWLEVRAAPVLHNMPCVTYGYEVHWSLPKRGLKCEREPRLQREP